MDLGKGWTTRIGSSRALTQVQAKAGADHHRRSSELDRDLGGIMAVILGVEVSRPTDFINQAEGAAVAEAAAAAAVAAAAIFHLLIRRPLNRTPTVHHATHFLPATFPTAMRLLLTAGVSRVGRHHLTSGMRSRAATNLGTTRGAATATRARAALKEGTTMVISPEAANFTSGRPAAEAVTTTRGTLPPIPTPTNRATTASRTTSHRSSSISSSSSSHKVHHLPLLLQPLHLLIPGRLPRPLLFTSLG